MDLFRPFLNRQSPISISETTDKLPKALFNSSLAQLKALSVNYYHREPSACRSILWHTCLLYIGNCVLRSTYLGDDQAFFLRLCVNSYVELAASFPIATGFLEGLLRLAIRDNMIDAAEMALITERLRAQSRHHAYGHRSAHIVDLELAMTNRKAALIDNSGEMAEGTAQG